MGWPIHSDQVVARARLLHSRGLNCRDISEALADENVTASPNVIRAWVKFKTRYGKTMKPPPRYKGKAA